LELPPFSLSAGGLSLAALHKLIELSHVLDIESDATPFSHKIFQESMRRTAGHSSTNHQHTHLSGDDLTVFDGIVSAQTKFHNFL